MHPYSYFLEIAEYELKIIKLRKTQAFPQEAIDSDGMLSGWPSGVEVKGEYGPQSFAFHQFSLF